MPSHRIRGHRIASDAIASQLMPSPRIRCHRIASDAIASQLMPSPRIRCHRIASDAIASQLMPSPRIRCHGIASDAIASHPMPSHRIRCHRIASDAIPGVLFWTVSDTGTFLNNPGSQTLPNGTNRRVSTHNPYVNTLPARGTSLTTSSALRLGLLLVRLVRSGVAERNEPNSAFWPAHWCCRTPRNLRLRLGSITKKK